MIRDWIEVGTPPSMHRVVEGVAKDWSITVNDLRSHRRTKDFVMARFQAMHEVRKRCGKSLPDIGRFFHRDHTTVLNALRRYEEIREMSRFEEAWSSLTPQMRLRSEAKAKVMARWNRAAKQVGEDKLLSAVRRYISQDADIKRTGGPGLQVWLNQGRYEHWLPTEIVARESRFPDEEIRTRIANALGEPFVVSWLDGCSLRDRDIITSSGTVFSRLSRLGIFSEMGLRIVFEGS